MGHRKNRFISCILIGSLILAVYACRTSAGNAEGEMKVKTPVTVVPVAFKPISETVDLSAVTVFMSKNIVRSTTTGTIEDISVTPGDFVNKDGLLFTIKTREAMAIQNSLAGDSTLGFKGIIKIFSPKEGIISSISHQYGDFVQEGDELAVVSGQNSLVFVLEVPFEFKGLIEKSSTCSLKLPDNTTITGIIRGRLPEMNVQAQTVSFIVKPVTSSRLPQNLIAVASIIKSSRKNAMVIPKPAVLGNEALTEFWVMKLINDSTAYKVSVRKGIETNSEVEITEPSFLPSDRVILTGNYGLPDTASITIMK